MPDIALTAADGFRPGAYLSSPEGQPIGGCVVLQEIFGVTDFNREVADELASWGFAQ